MDLRLYSLFLCFSFSLGKFTKKAQNLFFKLGTDFLILYFL